MNKTKIDWCDSTWSPVTGCLHGCEYCYARGIANRFRGYPDDGKLHELDSMMYASHRNEEGEWNGEHKCAYPYGFAPTFHRYRLSDYIGRKGRNIFVCSMADLFGKWVPDSWIEEVFKACEKAPQHNYLFLTKNPKRYNDLRNKGILNHSVNMWYGYSITKNKFIIPYVQERNVFVSIEPILEEIHIPHDDISCIDWVIIGAETGRRKDRVIPRREWIEDIVNECRKENIPIFMKSSLADIWGEALIQEYPKELKTAVC